MAMYVEINDKIIEAFEGAGGKRWTKGGKDRMYFRPTDFGLRVGYYNTGNVAWAKWDGETISNCHAKRILGAKYYVNLKTGSINDSGCYVKEDFAYFLREIADRVLSKEKQETYTPASEEKETV